MFAYEAERSLGEARCVDDKVRSVAFITSHATVPGCTGSDLHTSLSESWLCCCHIGRSLVEI